MEVAMWPQEQEERDFHVSTDSELDHEEAMQIARSYPPELQPAWISTDRDVWHKNPFYVGPPVPHPEDDHAWDERALEPLEHVIHDHYANVDDVTQPPLDCPF
jgi:hypothetical protein